MSAPIVPEDLVFPVRGENKDDFANKANTYVQRLATEVAPQQNLLGTWMNNEAVGVEANKTASEAARDLSLQYSQNSANSAIDSANSAVDAASNVQVVLDAQAQTNSLLGAGIGTSTLNGEGELLLTYVDAYVSNAEINEDGLLVITSV